MWATRVRRSSISVKNNDGLVLSRVASNCTRRAWSVALHAEMSVLRAENEARDSATWVPKLCHKGEFLCRRRKSDSSQTANAMYGNGVVVITIRRRERPRGSLFCKVATYGFLHCDKWAHLYLEVLITRFLFSFVTVTSRSTRNIRRRFTGIGFNPDSREHTLRGG